MTPPPQASLLALVSLFTSGALVGCFPYLAVQVLRHEWPPLEDKDWVAGGLFVGLALVALVVTGRAVFRRQRGALLDTSRLKGTAEEHGVAHLRASQRCSGWARVPLRAAACTEVGSRACWKRGRRGAPRRRCSVSRTRLPAPRPLSAASGKGGRCPGRASPAPGRSAPRSRPGSRGSARVVRTRASSSAESSGSPVNSGTRPRARSGRRQFRPVWSAWRSPAARRSEGARLAASKWPGSGGSGQGVVGPLGAA